MTKVVISQPIYWPWPGFLEQMMLADIYIWLDDVQFSKGSFTNRVQLLQGNKHKYMSIALQGKGSHQTIKDLKPAQENWQQTHFSQLETSLKHYPFKHEALTLFKNLGDDDNHSLCDLIIQSSEILAKALSITPPQILKSSDLNMKSVSNDRVLELMKHVKGTHYLTGHGAANYLDHERFEKENIDVSYMNYQPKPWRQNWQDKEGAKVKEFTAYVSSLDLIAATGYQKARTHLRPAIMPWRDFMAKIKE